MSNLLEMKNASISFGGVHAVRGVSFNVQKGEIIGLIGPNGSGKSTCVNLISGIYALDDGEIYFDGKLLGKKMRVCDRANLGMGRTFQTPKPFSHLTVFDNVYSIACQRNSPLEAKEKTMKILRDMKLYANKDMLSAKLPIEKRKWLDLARILATDPKFIMMDEVMAGLNHTEMQESIELVQRINEDGITILFIEHILKTVVTLCSRVVVLNEGNLLYEGTPADALGNDEVIKAYIGSAGRSAHA